MGCAGGALLLVVAGALARPAAAGGASASRSAAAPSEGARRDYERILGRLGIPADAGKVPADQWRRPRAERPMGHGLAKTAALLRHAPYLHRPVVFDDAARAASAKSSVDVNHSPLENPQIRVSDEGTIQRRVRRLYGALGGVLRHELAAAPAPLDGERIIVLEGGRHKKVNAVTLKNGGIIIHRRIVDVADQIGSAAAAARDGDELMRGLLAIARGSYVAPPGLPASQVRRYADGALVNVVAHELVHALKHHGGIGYAAPRQATRVQVAERAKETVSDLGGTDLALRAGFSPLGHAAFTLFFTMMRVVEGDLRASEDHPSPLDRYAALHRALLARVDRRRLVFDRAQGRGVGAPYLSRPMADELARLPTPDEARAFAARAMGRAR